MRLELKGIYKDYQQGKIIVPVLKDVNFSMEEGEYVAIMGISEFSSSSEAVCYFQCGNAAELCSCAEEGATRARFCST